MTCIVAVKTETNVVMGADSFFGNYYNYSGKIDNPKIFFNENQINKLLIGVCGSCRCSQILQFGWKRSNDKYDSPQEYMYLLINQIRNLLKNEGFAEIKNSQEEGGNFLVAFDSHLFEVQSDYSFLEIGGHVVIGSGIYLANGSLITSNKFAFSPQERVTLALEAAAENVTTVRPPFTILET